MRPSQSGGGGVLLLFLVSCSVLILSRAEESTSVFFLDSSVHRYFRGRAESNLPKSAALSLDEVGASVSVLLGLMPTTTLSASSSSELNRVLTPNPFNRPHAAFVLEIDGVADHSLLLSSELFKDGIARNVMLGSDKSNILLPDKSSFISLNGPLTSDYPSLTDAGVSKFASWMGGSYISDTSKELSGHLTIPLPDGASLNLHMEKKADKLYVANLVSLVDWVTKAIEMHEDISLGMDGVAELMKGSFDGIKVLQDAYGATEVTEQGLLVFLGTLTKLYDSLQTAYKGQVAGVILVNGAAASDAESLLNVILASRPSARWLEETPVASNSTEVEVMLVRWTLAWVTGVILLISTVLGIFLLLNMPLPKDTLLYANVKLE
ncbi:hypothetical protein MLD38_039506 [Melastoma candidum]|uniref:Uncharacterized protein n=1 Tax=Melastoma candidum TaxID=119954 RepID=A0ACB9L4M6_9MYRT|nr:hypothetical protein MLD38_039506 [Melastoma candidum]